MKRIDPNYKYLNIAITLQEATFDEFGGHLLIIRHPDWGCDTYM